MVLKLELVYPFVRRTNKALWKRELVDEVPRGRLHMQRLQGGRLHAAAASLWRLLLQGVSPGSYGSCCLRFSEGLLQAMLGGLRLSNVGYGRGSRRRLSK